MFEYKTAGTPAKYRDLHCVGMAGQGERVVLACDFRFPMHRIMSQKDSEHALSALRSLVQISS